MKDSTVDPMYLATIANNRDLNRFTEEIAAMQILAIHHFGDNVSPDIIVKLLELFKKK